MPNWAFNLLTVRAQNALSKDCEESKAELERFIQAVKSETELGKKPLPLSFDKLVPIPPEVLSAGGFTQTNWCTTHWGTKWDLDDNTTVENSSTYEVSYRFDTAWSAPQRFVLAAAKQFPHLDFCSRSADPATNWDLAFQVDEGGNVREESLVDFGRDAAEFWGLEDVFVREEL